MNLNEIVEKLNLKVLSGKELLDREIKGGYCSDLLSDVIANIKPNFIWITLQIHSNIVAVSVLKEIPAIIIANSRTPSNETLQKAKDEAICLLGSDLSSYELAGKLYKLGLRGVNE